MQTLPQPRGSNSPAETHRPWHLWDPDDQSFEGNAQGVLIENEEGGRLENVRVKLKPRRREGAGAGEHISRAVSRREPLAGARAQGVTPGPSSAPPPLTDWALCR